MNGNSDTLTARLDAPSKKRRGRRAGAFNYSTEDIDALLDFVEEVLPLGANMWAIVARKFDDWRKINGRPVRDGDS